MTNSSPSVSRFVLINLSVFLVIVLSFYAYSVYQTYTWGNDDSVHYFLSIKAEEIIAQQANSLEYGEEENYIIYDNYHSLPAAVKEKYSPEDLKPNELIFYETEESFHYILVYPLPNTNKTLLLEHPYYYLEDDYDMGISIEQLVLMMLLFSLVIGGLVYFRLVRKLTNQIRYLAQWCQSKSNQAEQDLNEDFHFVEIAQVASTLEESIKKLKLNTEREKNFLKSLSHELRTPLAISKASLEIIDKQNQNLPATIASKLDKIKFSNNNMCMLSDTLLLLWSETSQLPDAEETEINQVIQQSLNQFKHLQQSEGIQVSLEFDIERIAVPKQLFSILVANLVKNAFQYTEAGKISIQFINGQLSISNPLSSNSPTTIPSTESQQYGYGVGLFIVDNICKKLNWKIEIVTKDERFSVHVTI